MTELGSDVKKFVEKITELVCDRRGSLNVGGGALIMEHREHLHLGSDRNESRTKFLFEGEQQLEPSASFKEALTS